MSVRALFACIICMLFWKLGAPSYAEARDVRFALLVANEKGWKGDPHLRFAIRGDLLPFARVLRRIGFQVKTLQNPTPNQLRKALQWAKKRVSRAPQVNTFLFYYSGHADRKALHLGPRTRSPLTYQQLISFLRGLPVQRRIAFLDACFSGEIIREFGSLQKYRKFVRKGARGIRALDLTKSFPNQGDQSGLQIMTSSLDYSWESREYRASVFTHHVLKGLKGHADRDRDGKISVNELFNYVSETMHKEIRQKPLFVGFVQRTRAYALAPAYHSRLWIGPKVVGTIRVSVANFYWSRRKQRARPIQLAVVNGHGHVEVQHKGRCRRQRIYLPKGREARLRNQWKTISCKALTVVRKGTIELPAQLYQGPPRSRMWSLSGAGGVLGVSALGSTVLGGGELALWSRWGGIAVGAWGTSLQLGHHPQTQFLLDVRLIGGHRWDWSSFSLFAGAYVGAIGLFQDLNQEHVRSGVLFQAGGLLMPTFWWTERWGLDVQLQSGLTLGRFGGELLPSWGWSARMGIRFLL